MPVGSFNRERGTIDITGRNFAATRKYRNVAANPWAAFVVDDVLPPFQPRSVVVQGPAHVLCTDDNTLIRIVPETVISWGLDPSR